ncbi:uncharacterized protein BROUX77_004167 [Berkeleyomyces rouxiae]|uniref:uncharacterized protein n=1 Tax=Berkeleyomyces rouxiae TaxID=2035830 RepID=UPI003B7AD891
MPTPLYPQAKFDPIPPDIDLHKLVEATANFEWVLRVSASQIKNLSQQEFEKLVLLHVVQGGRPLVIDKWNEALPSDLFSVDWLEKNYDKKQENVRDIMNQADIPMTTGHYLRSMPKLANQWTPLNFRDERRQRLYLKDIDCPSEWEEALRKIIPPNLFYMNENVTDCGIPVSCGSSAPRSAEHLGAPSGDLMSSLPPQMRAENLMCYIGHEGTFTPAHREMCASLGQNIMVEASKGTHKHESEGSSIWFMTESKDREVVREYFLSMLGHDIEIEKHFAQINAWKKATFPVYVVEQKPGDFILVPPLAPHQVWNRGTRTIKVAWNRTTVETLELALHEALPKARLVCRDEQYKNKSIIYHTLHKYHEKMTQYKSHKNPDIGSLGEPNPSSVSPRWQTLETDFRRLFFLFADILSDEMFGFKETNIEFIEFDSNITCSFCRANIFNRFLTCKQCIRILVDDDEDTYDICMECYAMGRSCYCISNLQWCEQWKWNDLVDNYELWRATVIRNDNFIDFEHSPVPLELVNKKKRKKTLAQVCQEGLLRRPFKDKSKSRKFKSEESEPELEITTKGKARKPKRGAVKKLEEKQVLDTRRCHVCTHRHHLYKMQLCSTPGCEEAYCYATLYRSFDQTPQDVQQMEHWQCPKCVGNCNCSYCRRAGTVNYYLPKRTVLGHDTRLVADERSVESLVDFRTHNLLLLKRIGEDARSNTSKRMQHLRAQADHAKSRHRSAHEATEGVLARRVSSNNVSLSPAPREGSAMRGNDDSILLVADTTYDDIYLIENGDNSIYPDLDHSGAPITSEQPPKLHDLPGIGYYQQDDSDDRILFNPYQALSRDSLGLNESEMSKLACGSVQAAKRRFRQRNDDENDLKHQSQNVKQAKKSTLLNVVDLNGHVDPALRETQSGLPRLIPSGMSFTPYNFATTTHDSMKPVATTAVGAATHDLSDTERPGPNGILQRAHKARMDRADLWNMSLRHSKPRSSYAEGLCEKEEECLKDDVTMPYHTTGNGDLQDNRLSEPKHGNEISTSLSQRPSGKIKGANAVYVNFPVFALDLDKTKAASHADSSTVSGLGVQCTTKVSGRTRKSTSAKIVPPAPTRANPPRRARPSRIQSTSNENESSTRVHEDSLYSPLSSPGEAVLSMAERMRMCNQSFKFTQTEHTRPDVNSPNASEKVSTGGDGQHGTISKEAVTTRIPQEFATPLAWKSPSIKIEPSCEDDSLPDSVQSFNFTIPSHQQTVASPFNEQCSLYRNPHKSHEDTPESETNYSSIVGNKGPSRGRARGREREKKGGATGRIGQTSSHRAVAGLRSPMTDSDHIEQHETAHTSEKQNTSPTDLSHKDSNDNMPQRMSTRSTSLSQRGDPVASAPRRANATVRQGQGRSRGRARGARARS